MNDIRNSEIKGDKNSRTSGMSILHENICTFEFLVHVAERLDVEKWQVTKADKKKKEIRHKIIQDKFLEVGLLIDFVLQGKGSTSDGNTACRFFQNAEDTANRLGLDEDYVKRFANILSAINCGKKINVKAFQKYALRTVELHNQLYPWFYLSAHVHQLLMHGADIIENTLLPIGQLSEEAAEASNKIIRKMRENNTRKTSRLDSNTDLIHGLLATSDPYISTIRIKSLPSKKNLDINDVVKSLLIDESDGEDCEETDEKDEM